jgi:hypothetical protein
MCFFLAGAAHERGMAVVALSTRLLVHGLVIWIVFKYVLAAFDHFSPLLWRPFMLIEIFALLVCPSEDRTGIDRQTIRIGY